MSANPLWGELGRAWRAGGFYERVARHPELVRVLRFLHIVMGEEPPVENHPWQRPSPRI